MNPTRVERAEVLCGDARAGTLERTAHGSRFVYEPSFLEVCRQRGWGLGFQVPLREVVDTEGVNLHTFFAGLLPEGIRLQALERSVKTSRDDLFTLLMAAGSEAIGEVRVVPPGQPLLPAPVVDLGKLSETSFAKVLTASLDYRHGGERHLIPGVQPKVSAAMLTLPVRVRRRRQGEAMLKLEPPEYPRLIANELFFMTMARACGVEVADVAMVRDNTGAPGLVVTRFDRRPGSGATSIRLHCEDGCQFLDRYAADKYRVSFKDLALGVQRRVTSPKAELPRLLRVLAFSYLIGNGDLHARNVSLLVEPSGLVRLAPSYDLLTTLPYGDRRMALKVQGRDDNLKRAHLVDLGRQLGLGPVIVTRMLDEVCDAAGPFIERVGEIGFAAKAAARLAQVMTRRREELGTANSH